MKTICEVVLLLAGLCAGAGVLRAAEEPTPAADRLAFHPDGAGFRFNTGLLQGTLRKGGKSVGLATLYFRDTNTPVAASMGLCSHYRLLDAETRYGSAAWDWPSQAELRPDGSVSVHWSNDVAHPFDLSAVYRWAGPGTLDVTTRVTARRTLRQFESFLASYFQGFAGAFVYAQQPEGPMFMEAKQALGVWQMFPRDAAAVALIQDGRWTRPPNPVAWTIQRPLAGALALRRDTPTGLTAVLMAPSSDCFAISTPYSEEGHRSLYLSLFGRDISAGQTLTARARLVLGLGLSDAQAIQLYSRYLEIRSQAAD